MHCRHAALLALALALTPSPARAQVPPDVIRYEVDWPTALAARDLVWDATPDDWWSGAFVGNGGLGAMIYRDVDAGLHLEIGHTDVWDHQPEGGLGALRAGKTRLLVGGLTLRTVGRWRGGSARLDLWNAEARGDVVTDRGSLRWRTYTHAHDDVLVVDIDATGDESAAAWSFAAAPARSPWGNDPPRPNPASVSTVERVGDHDVFAATQTLVAGGGYATAWTEAPAPGAHRTLYLSVVYRADGDDAHARAVAAVERARTRGDDALVEEHRAWWHEEHARSHVEVPDVALGRFYQVQMYKLASATRAERPVYDLLGPWPRTTRWPGLWWNLNVQMVYWPTYAANRVALGESLTRALDGALRSGALAENEPVEAFRATSGAIATTSTPDLRSAYPLVEHCNLLWAAHDAWLHWRHTMDLALLRDTVVPLLKRATAYYLLRLSDAPVVGRRNIPAARSPEYDVQGPNPTVDVALLRWGLGALLEADAALALHDPDAPRWRETLRTLVELPQDDGGLSIATGVPLAHAHREPAHLMAIYPLHLLSWDDLAARPLIARSVARWARDPDVGLRGAHPDRSGYSDAWAASLYAAMGRGDDALDFLHSALEPIAPDTGVTPNTFYRDSGHATSETPMGVANALQDLLLQSWGGEIRVFPAVPSAWRDARFHHLRAEGAFLVSAVRRGGVTEAVQVISLAGEPCRVASDLPWPWEAVGARAFALSRRDDGAVSIDLRRGEVVLLRAARDDAGVTPTRAPVAAVGGCAAGPRALRGGALVAALGCCLARRRRRARTSARHRRANAVRSRHP